MSGNNTFRSDVELKKSAKEFFDLAIQTKCTTKEDIVKALPAGLYDDTYYGSRWIKGTVFNLDEKTVKAQNSLVNRCIKLLGTKIGHEEEIKSAAWEAAVSATVSDADTAIRGFYDSLDKMSQVLFVHYEPNYNISFEDDVREISIGPVKARMTADVIDEINSKKEAPYWEIKIGESHGYSTTEGNKITIVLPTICWEVQAKASKANTEEESLWLINVALSLLRLSHPQSHTNHFFPRAGESEALPIVKKELIKPGFTIDGDRVSINAAALPRMYLINKKIIKHLEEINFAGLAEKIFSSSKNTLGERIAQGLGWMTRGRQAADRAERFLFFFTALEALLTSSDKTAPITQTIARHASVILNNDVNARHAIAKEIQVSYHTRSQLVHGGRRNVSHREALYSQHLVEALYLNIINKIDLTIAAEEFEAMLSKASHGLSWP